MKYFELKRTQRIAPGQGEDLGCMLGTMAQEREDAMRAGPGSVEYWAGTVAQLLYIAADAFDAGAAASIGQKRMERYEQRARELKAKAAALYAEGRAAHDHRESEALLAAFLHGYDDTDHERMGNHSFDRRDAYLIGVHYRRQGLPCPTVMRSVYRDRDHWMEADGVPFKVEYPDGRVDKATAKVVTLAS